MYEHYHNSARGVMILFKGESQSDNRTTRWHLTRYRGTGKKKPMNQPVMSVARREAKGILPTQLMTELAGPDRK